MANVFLDLKTTSRLQDIQNALNREARKVLANNVKKIDDIVLKSINGSIIANRNDFIPTDREAGELGVGQDGSIDERKTDEAWKTLLVTTRGQNAITSFVILEQGGARPEFAFLSIVIDERQFYNHPLCNVQIDPSNDTEADSFSNIPWMRWLIEGAPRNPLYRFRPSRLGRTGEGTMRKSGVWNFRPARFGAFDRLTRTIERSIRSDIKKNIGKVI